MGKTIQLLVLCTALLGSQANAITGDNPFEKTRRIFAGAGSDWRIEDDSLRKSSQNESGTWYHIEVDRQAIRLLMTDSPDINSARSYKTLAIEDMQIDGWQVPVFTWCLQNQENHSRFLQQGMNVKMDICQNMGERGEFRVKLNDQTMQALEKGSRLSFMIKPYRTPVEVNFDIEKLSDAFAVLEFDKIKAQQQAIVSAPVATPLAPVRPVAVKAEPVKMCDATVPAGYEKLATVSYVCNDARDKIRAEKALAVAVSKEQARRDRIAKQQEQKRQAALAAEKRKQAELLAANKKREQEARRLEQERLAQQQAEQQAIAASSEKHNKVLDELTKKMVGVCNKMWSKGMHRCYCERYIDYAPAGIQSDPSCDSGA